MILGDSLQVMASLAEREGLRGKVQCIYIDPPYGIKFSDLKGAGFNLDLLGFDAAEMADIMQGREVNQPEYDESVASTVSMVTCPQCGQSFPK